MDTLGRTSVVKTAWLFVIASLMAVAACSSQSALPTHDRLARGLSQPTGLANGALLLRGDCVYLNGGTEPALVIWPRGYARLGLQIVDGGNPVAQIGEPLVLFGGSIEPAQYEQMRSTTGGSAIPPECETDLYWMATGVGPPQDV